MLGLRLHWLVMATFAAGCGEKAVELTLDWPNTNGAPYDVSCVNQIAVTVWDGDYEQEIECIEVTSSDSMQDIQRKIRGKFSMEMPDEMLAIQFHARATDTPETCPSGDLVFYAGKEYSGGEAMVLPVTELLDCSVRQSSTTHTAKVIDFRALVAGDPAAVPTCVAPELDDTLLESGTMHASNMSAPDWSPTVTTTWELANMLDGKITLPVWNQTVGRSCPTVITFDSEGYVDAAACMSTTAPTLCAGPGELEVPIFSYTDALNSWDDSIREFNKSAILVAVYDATTKKPIQGANITITDGDGEVVYGEWNTTESRFVAGPNTTTGVRGLAMVYSNEPVQVTIMAPGHRAQSRIAATPWESGGALLAVLPVN